MGALLRIHREASQKGWHIKSAASTGKLMKVLLVACGRRFVALWSRELNMSTRGLACPLVGAGDIWVTPAFTKSCVSGHQLRSEVFERGQRVVKQDPSMGTFWMHRVCPKFLHSTKAIPGDTELAHLPSTQSAKKR